MITLPALITILSYLLLFITTAVLYYKWRFTYWEKKGLAGPKPRFFFGNSQNPIARKSTPYVHVKNIYDEMKKQKRDHCGIYIFSSPSYLPINPEYIKAITTKDFAHFVDRGMYYNEEDDPLSAHLLSLEGQQWKNLRAKLTPTFSSGKIKGTFNVLVNCAEQMVDATNTLIGKPLDIKEICACYTTDVIGSTAFGFDCNSFANKESEFRKYGKKAFEPSASNIMRIVIAASFKKLAKKLRMKLIDPEVSDFFMNVTKTTLKYREENQVVRNDFLQLLIELKRTGELRVEEVAAQSFLFFLAGFETSSTTMLSCLFELATNEKIQDKLREEIEEVLSRSDDKLTYENLMEMKYLGQVIDETLRKYPTIPMIQRVCTKDYKLPNCDVILEKGTQVFLPVFALHRDPEYYPDPEKFDPDRFNDKNRANRHPSVYMPFGEGPRVCIGQRFGLMQVKIGIVMLLKNYKFTLNPSTSIPLEFDRNGFLLQLKNTVWLDALKL